MEKFCQNKNVLILIRLSDGLPPSLVSTMQLVSRQTRHILNLIILTFTLVEFGSYGTKSQFYLERLFSRFKNQCQLIRSREE